jgi:hypothetical protein
MADLMQALRNADAAGDTEAAARIASMIKSQQGAATAQPEERSTLDEFGRQLGLTGRHAIEGVGGALGMVSDPFGQFLPGYQKTGEAAAGLADTLGLPKPEGGLEENVGAASRALSGQAATMGAGTAAKAAQLTAQPLMQAISSIAGGSAADATRQGGGGDIAQTLAGLGAGGGVGMAAGIPGITKALMRGSEGGAGQAKMLENLAAFEAAGSTPSVGQATQGRIPQALESLLSKTPGAAGVMAKKATGQADEIGGRLSGLADELAPKTNPTTAGRVIEQGISGEGGFVSRFKAKASQLYDEVDQHMPPDTAVPVRATVQFLSKVSAPTKGAEATSALLANPKLGAIGGALAEDLAKVQNGSLPYQAVKDLRSRVGDMIADSGLTSDVPRAQLKQLYGALSQDIRNQASKDPKAFAATNRAENYYRAGMDRIEKVESVVDRAGGPENIFKAATSGTREGATTLRGVMQSLQPDEAKVVTSAVVRRLGRANPGAQNDTGDAFSTETFLTNWNGMSPEAKGVLFNRMGSGFRENMDQVAKVASNLRQGSNVFKNPSGTGQALAQGTTVTAAVMSILTGHPVAAASLGAGVGTANLAAKAMTNPTFVKWLASNSNRPVGALSGQIGALASQAQKDDDPDALELAQMLGGQ